MKEFIEKMIGRLEEKSVEITFPLYPDDSTSFVPITEAIKIANQLAEEYNNKLVKGDFISKSALIDWINKQREEVTNKQVSGSDGIFTREALVTMQIVIGTFEKAINNQPTACNDGWISCSERLPEVETKVLIHAKRKYRDGSFKDIITTAMHEDGTMLENDSKWHWEDIEGEWDEENDCYIIPEGWWEDKIYNADGELNHAVDDEVIEWQPLPPPYQPGK